MNLESKLISGCLIDGALLAKAKRAKIKPSHLEDGILSYIYKSILDVSKSEAPTPDVVKQFIMMDDKRSEDSKKVLCKKINALVKEGKEGSAITIERLKEMRIDRDMTSLLIDTTGQLNDGADSAEVAKHLMNRLKEIEPSEEEYHLTHYYEDWDVRKVERIEINEGSDRTMKMCLNMVPFAPYFPRGVQPEEVTAIGGPTYAGKSVLLSNLIRVAAHPENGFNVLYVFAENRKIQAASRLDSIILGRNYDRLYDGMLKDPEGDSFFKAPTEDGWGEIVMAKVTPRKFTSSTIRAMIEEIKDQHGIEIDVIAIDSPDHQMPEDEAKDWWQNKGLVYWDNKALAEEFEVMVFCTLPMKASSVKKESVTSEDAGGSYDISRICDNMIMFNLDPADRMLNRGKIQVTKVRDASTDNKIIHFYFENNHRLLPWEEVFSGQIEPGIEANEDAVFKIKQFKDIYNKKQNLEKVGDGDKAFNVRK